MSSFSNKAQGTDFGTDKEEKKKQKKKKGTFDDDLSWSANSNSGNTGNKGDEFGCIVNVVGHCCGCGLDGGDQCNQTSGPADNVCNNFNSCCCCCDGNGNGNENDGDGDDYEGQDGRDGQDGQDGGQSRKNLDSGYAWLILIVMFLLQSSISGASRVYGIVYAKEVSINYYDREQASWPIATASTVENLASILTPALASYLSWRNIELLSTSLLILSNLLAYFSSSLTVDILALGVIQGLALSTCTVLSLVINNDYFERYRTTAYGISMSGSTFGVLYLSPLVSWLLEEYDNFRLVYLALALVFCGNMVLVLFIKPRATTIKDQPDRNELANVVVSSSSSGGGLKNGHQLDVDKIRNVLESLEDKQQLGSSSVAERTRKRSRFETLLERKNSVASVSYRARSRRASVLSKQHSSSIAPSNNQAQTNSIYVIEQAAAAAALPYSMQWPDVDAKTAPGDAHALASTTMLGKSKSGIELARTTSECFQEPQKWQHKISLCNQRSSPYCTNMGSTELTNSGNGGGGGAKECQVVDSSSQISIEGCTACKSDGHRAVDMDSNGLQLSASRPASRSPSMLLTTPCKQQYYANCANGAPSISLQCKKNAANANKKSIKLAPKRGFTMESTMQLLRLPYLHCTWIMLAIYYLIARIFVIILVDFADDHGFSLSESTNLLNYWSIGELCGRIVLGPLIDLQYMSSKNCIVTTCLLLAACIATMVIVENYIAYAVCSMAIAALISLEYMLINVLMVEYVGKDQVASLYPLAACLSSLILVARPSLIGLFRDHLGSYNGLLVLLASLSAAFALLFYIFEPLLVRHWPKQQLEYQQRQQQQTRRPHHPKQQQQTK